MTGDNGDFGFCAGLRELLTGMSVPVVIGAAFGFLNLLRKGGDLSWRQRIISLISSIFVGVLVYWGLNLFDFPPTVDAAIVAGAAYMGGAFLDAIQSRTLREVRHGKSIFKGGE